MTQGLFGSIEKETLIFAKKEPPRNAGLFLHQCTNGLVKMAGQCKSLKLEVKVLYLVLIVLYNIIIYYCQSSVLNITGTYIVNFCYGLQEL